MEGSGRYRLGVYWRSQVRDTEHSWGLCEFKTAVTQYHELVCCLLEARDVYHLPVLKVRNLNSKCLQGQAPSDRGSIFFSPLSELLVNLVCSSIPLVSASAVTWSPPLGVCVQILPLLEGQQSCWSQAHIKDLILIWICMQRPCFHSRSRSQVPGMRPSTVFQVGC